MQLVVPLSREFSNERGRVERRAQYQRSRSRQMFIDAMIAYLDWITQAGVIIRVPIPIADATVHKRYFVMPRALTPSI